MQSIATSCRTSSFNICYNYGLNFWLHISQKEISEWTIWYDQIILSSNYLSQLREYIEKHPSETQRLLGMDYDKLIELITHAQNLYNHQKKLQEIHKTRLLKAGSGRQPKLAIATNFSWRSLYLHHWPTFQILGVQFGVSESTANYLYISPQAKNLR